MLKHLGYSLAGATARRSRRAAITRTATRSSSYINRQVHAVPWPRAAGHLGGHEEEGTGRPLFKNGGREWQPKGSPRRCKVHDFPDRDVGKAIPVRRLRRRPTTRVGERRQRPRHGRVRGGEHPAVVAARWASALYPRRRAAADLRRRRRQQRLPSCGCGRWNSRRLADETGLAITVCHFPPGTSKWNKIEHRLFSYISMNWRGRPLISHEVIVNLIAATTTATGLKVRAHSDRRTSIHSTWK